MPTWEDILNDKTAYPDDRSITLSDGVEVRLGDLRKGSMLERDYRQKTSQVAREKEEVARQRQELDSARQDAETKLTELAERAIRQQKPETQDEVDQILQRDPVAQRLQAKLDEIDRRAKEAADRSAALETAWKTRQQEDLVNFHRYKIAALKQRDPNLDVDALVTYARTHGVVDLDVAHQAMTEGERWKRETEKIRTEEREKAKKEIELARANPVLPSARRFVPPAPGANDPKTMDEAAQTAASDPDILAVLSGQAGGPA